VTVLIAAPATVVVTGVGTAAASSTAETVAATSGALISE
jgi:hypothetical protein